MASDGQDRADALGWGRRPNRPPKTFARTHTIPQKVTTVSIYDKGPGHPEGCPDPAEVHCVMKILAGVRGHKRPHDTEAGIGAARSMERPELNGKAPTL